MVNEPAPLGVDKLVKHIGQFKLPPIHKWNPPFCGDIDIKISRDGAWRYQGSLITRKKLMRLFSTVLRREDDDQYYLVTPVEKVRITVDDVPFVAVDVEISGSGETQELQFETNLGDSVVVDHDHLMWVVNDPLSGEPSPYVRVRDRLNALITRAVYYRLVDLAQEKIVDGVSHLGLFSRGQFFSLGILEKEGKQSDD